MPHEESDVLEEQKEYQLLSDFLESTPPNQNVYISDLMANQYVHNDRVWKDVLSTPEIQLHCGSEICNGMRIFRSIQSIYIELTEEFKYTYISYRCSNCQISKKTFSMAARRESPKSKRGEVFKFGEMPNFGPPTPARLIKLIGPDRENFLKGRRCENQGLGVGAFIYYRRVVEHQKNRILSEIIKVSEKLSASPERIDTLKLAIEETQFSKALDMAKDVIPESLLINGHSPIQLLHSALSEGVHALTDEKCLELASSVRIVLGELSERLSQALKDEAELSKALSTLMHFKKS